MLPLLGLADKRVPDKRLHVLDGVRGWGALAVVLFHLFVEGFPIGEWSRTHLWRVPLFHGTFAVLVFFLVSGVALSTGYFMTGAARELARLAAGRYLRLALPVAGACLLVFALMKLGLIPRWQERPPPFDAMLRFDPSLRHLAYFVSWGVFFDYSYQATFIGPLWTMPIELTGSFVVFAVLALAGRSRHRVAVFGALGIALFAIGSVYCLFVAGLIAADLYVRSGTTPRPTLGLALMLAGVTLSALGDAPATIAHRPMLASVALLAGILMFEPAQKFFSNPVSRWLGRMSFPLYLMHGPVLFAFSLPLLAALRRAGLDEAWARPLTAGVTLPVAFLASYVLLPANGLATRLARQFARTLIPSPSPDA